MSETIDPLLFLREYITNSRPIEIVDKQLDFGNGLLRMPLDTQTAWKRSDKEVFYTLGSLYLAYTFFNSKMSDYNVKAKELQI